jgi:hypothetical protein
MKTSLFLLAVASAALLSGCLPPPGYPGPYTQTESATGSTVTPAQPPPPPPAPIIPLIPLIPIAPVPHP